MPVLTADRPATEAEKSYHYSNFCLVCHRVDAAWSRRVNPRIRVDDEPCFTRCRVRDHIFPPTARTCRFWPAVKTGTKTASGVKPKFSAVVKATTDRCVAQLPAHSNGTHCNTGVIPTRISTDLCALVSERGVASPQAIFQIDAATRQQKRISARNPSNDESKLLRAGITAGSSWSSACIRT